MSFYDRAKVWAVKGLKTCCCFPMSSFCMTYGFMLMAVKGLALWFVCLWESERSKRSFRNSKGQHRGRMTPQTSHAFWTGSIMCVYMSVSVCVCPSLCLSLHCVSFVSVCVVAFDCVHTWIQYVPVCVRVCLVYRQRKGACGLTKTNSRVCSSSVNVYQHMISSLPFSCHRLAGCWSMCFGHAQALLCILHDK